MRILVLLLAGLAALPARAGMLELEGHFQQGGLVHGRTDPAARVVLNGRDVRVSPSGRFLIGFGRDAEPTAAFSVHFPDGTSEGRTLRIKKRTYKIQRIDGLPRKMVTPPESEWARIKAENGRIAELRAVDRPEPLFESGFEWPALGRISGVFGSQRILNGEARRPHFGVDVAAPVGTPILAPAEGIVVLAHPDMYYTGGTVMLDHGHGLTSVYSHMQSVLAKEGERVTQGTPIGTLGSTGRATGPHLDWRINWFDQRLDPALLVGPMPAAGATE
jgi:murein DD-endopeptidase MepM/ murein hydrolase activator NlpD